MRLPSFAVTLIGSTLCLLALNFSASNGQVVSHIGGLARNDTPAAIFISANKDVDVFDKSLHLITKIKTKFLESGGAVANDGTLYLGFAYESLIQIFKPPYTAKPIEFHLTNPQHQPLSLSSIAIDRRTGLIAMSAFVNSHLQGGPAGVFFFRPGETVPCDYVRGDVDIVTFDAEGTLFYTTSLTNGVGMVRGGCSATTLQALSLNAVVLGIAVDGDDNIVVQVNAAGQFELQTYRHPIVGQFNAPIATTIEPFHCYIGKFTSDGKYHWDACYDSNKSIKEYQYEVNGPPLRTLQEHKKLLDLIDVLPPLVP